MKALFFDGKKAVYREDLPIPEPLQNQSLIEIICADICSTDREILKGYRPDFKGIMGHEFVGRVVKSEDPTLLGKIVVGELNEGCGNCIYCKTQREKHCLSRKVIGMSKDGCFAEYMTLANHLLHPVPQGLDPLKAVFTEPLAAAIEITKQVEFDPQKNIAIVGDGRLSFMICQVLALKNLDITVIGRHDEKLKMFEPYAKTVNSSNFYDGENLKNLRAEDCFEYVIDASGSPDGFYLSMNILRKMGTLILKSTYAGSINIDLSIIPVNEFTIIGSRCGPFKDALKLLSEGRVQFPDVELYDLSEYEQAFASNAFKSGFLIKKDMI